MFHGIIPVWKERGMTSHDVVFKLRKLLKMKKIGHTGTLDPQVDGVLVVCLGEATKLVELLMDGRKVYQGEVMLGYATETEDAHGLEVARKDVVEPVDTDVIDEAMQQMVGHIQQIPPYYSAIKVNGKRLYEYARAGVEVERPVRRVYVEEFVRTSEPIYCAKTNTQRWTFRVTCGKGTYVRTLAVDLGAKLGYPSHMSQLTRYATGGFSKEEAYTLTQLEQLMNTQVIQQAIYPLESALSDYPQVTIDSEGHLRIVRNGQVVEADALGERIVEATVVMYQERALAIYAPHPTKTGLIKPIRMFQQRQAESDI